ncbi:MAG TPA: sec-independent translocase [Acidothermaceae bacterium]
MPFDLSMWKLLVLGVIALIVFGPDRLPQLARDAGRTLRQLREMAQAARTELKSELGDTVGDFDFADLNPRTFVRKHLLDDLDSDLASPAPTRAAASASTAGTTAAGGVASPSPAAFGPLTEPAPYDLDAT